jgi:hypothetical protein
MPRILGNPKVDYVTAKLTEEKAHFETAAKQFAKPMSPRPFPLLAPLTGNFVNPSFGEAAVEDGKLNLLRLSFDDGQRFEFRRE